MGADQPWMDATHSFDKEVQMLTANVMKETKAENARRFKAPAPTPKQYQVGDEETFWTKNIVDNKFEPTAAVLKAIGKSCYIFVEKGQVVADAAVEKIKKSFDETIYPIDTKVFGQEWKPGIDGDERITLLMFDIKDGFNGQGGFVAGYFFAGDQFLQSQIPSNIPVKSNEREMFYLDLNPGDPSSDRYMSVVAHEFQHMIHFHQDAKELTWVNESCSQIAPYLCGFGHAGQITSFMKTPDNSLTAWAQDQMLANYGQVYLWNYFLMNQYLKDAAGLTKFFRELVADPTQGAAGFDRALSKFKTFFDTEFVRFNIANFVNDPRLQNGIFAYDDSLRRLRLPPVATVKALPATIKEEVFMFSADGIKVDLSSAKQTINLEFTGKIPAVSGKKGSFNIAAVFSDSRNKETPKLFYVKLDASGNGTAALNREGLDSLTIVVSTLAPKGVGDKEHAGMKTSYQLKIDDAGTPAVAAGTTEAPADELLSRYVTFASGLERADAGAAEASLNALEGLNAEIGRSVAGQLENGSFGTIDALIEAGNNDSAKASLKPLAKKLAGQVEAWKLQNRNSRGNLDSRIEALKSF
jgi:hypothetical protein